MATLWERDAFGRLRRHPKVAVAVADDGLAVRFDLALPRELQRALEEVPIVGSSLQAILETYREIIEPYGRVESSGGPSYVFSREIGSVPSSDLEIVTSSDTVSPSLFAGRPEAWWEPGEWSDLLSGRLGPWAFGMINGAVAAICHTPVGSALAAEAGVWTHPEARGRGYATAVTAAWAAVACQRFETLFYSTSFDNVASQSVARKLGLAPIGTIWQLNR